MRLQLVPAFTLIAGIVLGFALHALTVGPTAGLPSLQAAPRPFERRSISVNSPIAPESGVPPAWNPGEALMSTGFQCVDGRDKPWAIIHESDYDSRTLRVMWKWVPEYRAALPELLTRGWWVVRIGPSQSQPSHESSSARTRSDEACLAAPASCLHLTSDVLARLPFPCPSCGASHDTATLAARNAAALLAAACGASHVLELEASVMINVSVPVTYLLNPTSAAWAAGPAGLRDRMAGAGTVKIVAADEPPSGGFVHALAALGEPLLFARGLPVARVPNVSMSALDMRAPMDELPPAVAIHVFVPGGTPDLSAATRAFFRGQLPRRVYATRNKVINPGSEPPLGNALHVRALNPGSFAVFGGVATLWSREAFGVMLLPPASACTPEVGVWGAESARSLVATATLHLSGATVAFVGGLQPFYRPFAPVTTAELLAEAATDVLIEVTAGVLVPAVREQLADPAQGFPLDTAAASDAVTAALLAAGALPLESVHEWQRWSADLSGVGWLPMPPEKQSRARQGGRSGLFTSPLGLCNDPIAAPPAVHRVRAAVCVTGEVHNIDSLVSALGGLDPYFPGGNMHVFFFGAAFLMPHKEMQNIFRLQTTRTFLYGDRLVLTRDLSDLSSIGGPRNRTDVFPDAAPEGFNAVAPGSLGELRQQYWAQAVCYDAVRAWGATHSIEYELLIRQRSDHTFVADATALPPPLPAGFAFDHLVVPDELHFAGVNDRWGIGGLDVMWPYMGRLCAMLRTRVINPWSEPYLQRAYRDAGIRVVPDGRLKSQESGYAHTQRDSCGSFSPDLPALVRSN